MKNNENGGSKAGAGGTNDTLTEDLTKIIQSKASFLDVQKLRDEKTNKIDCQAQLHCIQIMHKMLVHLSVLLIETVKSGVRTNQSEVEKQ